MTETAITPRSTITAIKSKAEINLQGTDIGTNRWLAEAHSLLEGDYKLTTAANAPIVKKELLAMASQGLIPNIHANIIVFKGTPKLYVNVKGVRWLLNRLDGIEVMPPRLVRDGELFDLVYTHEGTEMRHQPMLTGKKPGEIVGGYVTYSVKGERSVFWMARSQFDALAATKKKDSIWSTHFDKACLKTLTLHLARQLPIDAGIRVSLTPNEAADEDTDYAPPITEAADPRGEMPPPTSQSKAPAAKPRQRKAPAKAAAKPATPPAAEQKVIDAEVQTEDATDEAAETAADTASAAPETPPQEDNAAPSADADAGGGGDLSPPPDVDGWDD